MKKQKELKKLDVLVINRAKWISGGGNSYKEGVGEGSAALLNFESYMCCLGFACQQAGISKKKLQLFSMPNSLDVIIPKFTKKVDGEVLDTKLSEKAAEINDNKGLTIEEREKKLKALFSKYKIKVEFKGKYAKK